MPDSSPHNKCRHLGNGQSRSAILHLTPLRGKPRELHLQVHDCSLYGKCLPAYVCIKNAVAELLTLDGEPVSIQGCRQCRAEGLGYEPAEPAA